MNESHATEHLLRNIPTKYLNDLLAFLVEKRYGSYSLIIQNGEVVGCDILEKKRI
ncbi:MAG: DUF2292 domain-containing protein [Thermincola sp.]|nr:DUF2292 domain-containing protein [Thermincola sp.]MDT3701719.1 DUF2292 domain-containing protein [Thermincola sp.]